MPQRKADTTTTAKKPTRPRRPPDRVLTNYYCIEETILELLYLSECMPKRASDKARASLRSALNLLSSLNVGNSKWLRENGVKIAAPDPPAWHSHPATKKQIELITDLCDACGYDTAGKRRKYLKGLGFNGATAMLTKGQASAVIRNLFSEVERMEEEAAWMSECWEEEW